MTQDKISDAGYYNTGRCCDTTFGVLKVNYSDGTHTLTVSQRDWDKLGGASIIATLRARARLGLTGAVHMKPVFGSLDALLEWRQRPRPAYEGWGE